jgi:hypothetical protein
VRCEIIASLAQTPFFNCYSAATALRFNDTDSSQRFRSRMNNVHSFITTDKPPLLPTHLTFYNTLHACVKRELIFSTVCVIKVLSVVFTRNLAASFWLSSRACNISENVNVYRHAHDLPSTRKPKVLTAKQLLIR